MLINLRDDNYILMSSIVDVFKDLFCGCMSGWGQVVTMMPFENINAKIVSKPQEYKNGYVDAFKKTIAEEGFFSLYKGMAMPLIGVGLQVSVQFGFVETLKKYLKKKYADKDGNLPAQYSMLSGFIAGLPSSLIVTPLDHARFRVALIKEKGMGSVKMAMHIAKTYGLQKLYLGFLPTWMRESLCLATYFGVYDLLIRNFDKTAQSFLMYSLLCGGVAGVACWTIGYPASYIKLLLQTDDLQNPKLKGAISCAKGVYEKGGITEFYRGFGIMAVRAFVVNGFGFVCFEIGKKIVY